MCKGFQRVFVLMGMGFAVAFSGCNGPEAPAPAKPSAVVRGGQDSGGGDAQLFSSQEQVVRMIGVTKKVVYETIVNGKVLIPASQQDPDVRAFLQRMQDQGDLYTQIRNTEFQARLEEGSCLGPDGKASDASTQLNVKGAPICFDVKRLMRVPARDLLAQLTAISVHELSHQFGADEALAVKIQRDLLKNYERVAFDHSEGIERAMALTWMRFLAGSLGIIEAAVERIQGPDRTLWLMVDTLKRPADTLGYFLRDHQFFVNPIWTDEQVERGLEVLSDVERIIADGDTQEERVDPRTPEYWSTLAQRAKANKEVLKELLVSFETR